MLFVFPLITVTVSGQTCSHSHHFFIEDNSFFTQPRSVLLVVLQWYMDWIVRLKGFFCYQTEFYEY